MDLTLDPVEIRVAAALAEKELATPDYYPMSLNALAAACNQKTGREPVMDLAEDEIARALDRLMRQGLAGTSSGAGSRVEKYRHNLAGHFGLNEAELSVLAVLMLRGPQTVGEVRSRTGRMHAFEELEGAEAALRALAERDEPLVTELPLQPGRKEPRWAHLLGGPVEAEAGDAPAPTAPAAMQQARASGDRIAELEGRVEALEGELGDLQEAFERFRKQFE
ncbi:MAG: DUF480 domain-containing protein [Rhodothermales bacterium]|nr:DUF480 domain-containing protein [Rhodothermales bacterium]